MTLSLEERERRRIDKEIANAKKKEEKKKKMEERKIALEQWLADKPKRKAFRKAQWLLEEPKRLDDRLNRFKQKNPSLVEFLLRYNKPDVDFNINDVIKSNVKIVLGEKDGEVVYDLFWLYDNFHSRSISSQQQNVIIRGLRSVYSDAQNKLREIEEKRRKLRTSIDRGDEYNYLRFEHTFTKEGQHAYTHFMNLTHGDLEAKKNKGFGLANKSGEQEKIIFGTEVIL
jgi:hypothetical protein